MRFTRSLRYAAISVLVAGSTLTGLTPPASAGPEPAAEPVTFMVGPMYRFRTTKTMAILNASTAHTAPMILAQYTTGAPHNDRMLLEWESTADVFRIKPLHTYSHDGNVHNDKCLAVQNGDLGNNVPIVNANCTYDSANNDVWLEELTTILSGGYPVVQFRNQATGRCITVQNGSTANNARLITFTCENNDNDLWVQHPA